MSAVKVTAMEDRMSQEKKLKPEEKKLENVEAEEYFLTLDFDGQEVECAIIDEFELDGKNYIVLLPEDEEEAYLYAYTEKEDGEISLENLEEAEFQKVAVEYMKRSKEDE